MNNNVEIINMREQPQMLERAAEYFSSRWGIDKSIYVYSINACISTIYPVPRWYLMLRGDEIIGGCGLIDNDFMTDTEFYPWLCALIVEPSERGKNLGAQLLNHVCTDAAKSGCEKVYLNTDHVGYYERYNWKYIGDFLHASGDNVRVYEADTFRVETSRFVLRPVVLSDASAMMDILEDEFENEKAACDWISFVHENTCIKKPFVVFAIESKQTGECIGRVYFHSKIELNGEVEIGYNIDKRYRNCGYATEAAKAVIWFAFEVAGQDVISAILKPENIASRRVIEKLGFVNGGKRSVMDDCGELFEFDYFRLYHSDHLPGPQWNADELYKAELMGDFFDIRAEGYKEHMFLDGGEENYRKLGSFIPKTNEPVKILDIGCGTGIELNHIWSQAPNAHITCLDLSRGMLDLLLKNHSECHDKIQIIEASYIDWDYPENTFDIVVSKATMHHLRENEKIDVYRKILRTLKPGGIYIESDFIVDDLHSKHYKKRYETITANLSAETKPGEYHIDIPFTVDVQKKLLFSAGFSSVEVLDEDIKLRGSTAILQAEKL